MRRFPPQFWIGALGLAFSEYCLFAKIEPIHTFFYSWAWWSYILLVDGIVKWKRGESLLSDRPKELLVLSFWSIAAWNVYEVFNFRLQNWYYVMVPPDPLMQVIHGNLAFATVLPGVFLTTDLLESFGLFSRVRMRPWKVSDGLLASIFCIGLAMGALCLLWPHLFFGLVWGSVAFVLEPIVHKKGGRSLLRDFERGEPGRFLRLLAAGLVTGGLWEFWNYWTRTKWIYTVPGLEELKLFEMPLAGFIGFPPFVVECYVMYAFLGLFRGNKGWERGADGPGMTRRFAWASFAVACVFNLVVGNFIWLWTMSSFDAPLATAPGVTKVDAGIERPFDLLRAIEKKGRDAVARESGLAPPRIAELEARSRLIENKGIGVQNAWLLDQAEITTLEDLAGRDPAGLTLQLEEIAKIWEWPAPYEAQVAVWIRAARKHSVPGGEPADGAGVSVR